MAINDLSQSVQGILQQGKIEEALDALIKGLGDHRSLQKDAVQLKTNYAQARYQYEVQAILPRTEFEIIQNKTINGIQAIVGRLELTDQPASSARTWWIAGIIAAVVIAFGLWRLISQAGERGGTLTEPAAREVRQVPANPVGVTDSTPGLAQPSVITRKKKAEETTPQHKCPIVPSTSASDKPSAATSPPPETCAFRLILNTNMIDAGILIDGKPAHLAKGAGTQVQTIETTPGNHKITLRNNKLGCSFDARISAGGQIMQPATCN